MEIDMLNLLQAGNLDYLSKKKKIAHFNFLWLNFM